MKKKLQGDFRKTFLEELIIGRHSFSQDKTPPPHQV